MVSKLKNVLYIALVSLLWLSASFPVNGKIFGYSWSNDPQKLSTQSFLAEFLRADSDHFLVNESNIQQEFAAFVSKLEDKRARYSNELDFLSYLYYKVHRKYLHRYSTPVSMNALFDKGRYDCLTGTAFYALLFEALGMEYQIVETTYHIYLTLTVDGQPVLIESTNPLGGIITNRQQIAELKKAYASPQAALQANQYIFQEPVNQVIDLTQLAGLHYYNLALNSYNQHDLESALSHMEQALSRYSSQRLNETMQVMLGTLKSDQKVDVSLRDYYLPKYAYINPQADTSQNPWLNFCVPH